MTEVNGWFSHLERRCHSVGLGHLVRLISEVFWQAVMLRVSESGFSSPELRSMWYYLIDWISSLGAAPRKNLVFGRWVLYLYDHLVEKPAGSTWCEIKRMDSWQSGVFCGPESILRPRSPSLMVISVGRNSLSWEYPPDLWILRVQIAVPGHIVCRQPGLATCWLNTWPWFLNSSVGCFL